MRQRGFLVDLARDGNEAWQLASQFPYAVVVTDLRMPGTDGMKLVSQIKGLIPAPNCVLVTGVPGLDWVGANSPQAQGVPVIKKPWDGDQLAAALRAAIEEYSERRQESSVVARRPPDEARGTKVLLLQGKRESGERVRDLLKKSSALEYEVTIAPSLEAAQKILVTHPFDVCLVDLTGKPLSATSIVERIRASSPRLPIVVFSPDEYEEVALRVMAAGAQDYLCSSEIDDRGLRRALRYAIERRRAIDNLDTLAHKDVLTQLANRVRVRERLNEVLGKARRGDQRIGLVFLDVDRFKAVIDGFGHGVGDQLLQQVASRLSACVRETDTVGRMGGDEFAVLLENLRQPADATQLAQRILNSFATPFAIAGESLAVTASIGISLYPDNGKDADELMRSADAALYLAKDAGRNNYQYYGEEIRQRVAKRVDLEADLRRALEREEFVLHYQPRISLVDNCVVGAEALLRWQRQGEELAFPGEFLHVLEETGLIVEVGAWVHAQALHDLAQIRRQGHKDLTVSINVAAAEFEREDFIESVECALAAARLPASALEIEISERVLNLDSRAARRTMDHLRQVDIKLVVDNFGKGATSLVLLKRSPVKAIKLARSLVSGIAKDADQVAVVSAAVALADSLELEIGAEGAEEAGQVDLLKAVGCEQVQGFHICRPRPLQELLHFIATWSGTRTTPPPGGGAKGGYSITPT